MAAKGLEEAELGEGLARLWLDSGLVRPPGWPAASAGADWPPRLRGRRALRWTAARPQLTAEPGPAATTAAAEQGAERPAEEEERRMKRTEREQRHQAAKGRKSILFGWQTGQLKNPTALRKFKDT